MDLEKYRPFPELAPGLLYVPHSSGELKAVLGWCTDQDAFVPHTFSCACGGTHVVRAATPTFTGAFSFPSSRYEYQIFEPTGGGFVTVARLWSQTKGIRPEDHLEVGAAFSWEGALLVAGHNFDVKIRWLGQ
jgi:hypothetical protein